MEDGVKKEIDEALDYSARYILDNFTKLNDEKVRKAGGAERRQTYGGK